ATRPCRVRLEVSGIGSRRGEKRQRTLHLTRIFDNRRRQIVERALPPHPYPLPWGEGASLRRILRWRGLCFIERCEMVLPLPKGEGRGEGEPGMRTRIAFRGF